MRTITDTLGACLFALVCSVTAVRAEMTCELRAQPCRDDCPVVEVVFDVDPAQFVAPLDPNDPPRRQVTLVRMDDVQFVAQAILMPNGATGFHEDAGALGSRLMIVQPDGRARLVLQPQNTTLTGTCQP